MRKASPRDFRINEPLPWPVYDKNGVLLLREGFVIAMPEYIQKLMDRGAFIDEKDFDSKFYASQQNAGSAMQRSLSARNDIDDGQINIPKPIFQRVQSYRGVLRRIHRMIRDPEMKPNLVPQTVGLANALLEALQQDADAVLGALFLERDPRDYRVNQQILGAVCAVLLACADGQNKDFCLDLACGGLTRDLGLLDFDLLIGLDYQGALTDSMVKLLDGHTTVSIKTLIECGVKHRVWVEAVADHHERPDGKGYPRKLGGDAISRAGSYMSVADAYASMVTPGGYRKAVSTRDAFADLLAREGEYVPTIVESLCRLLTPYPPGTLVRLANGEAGVVMKRSNTSVLVISIYDRANTPLTAAVERNTVDPLYSIVGIEQPSDFRAIDVITKKLWI